MSRARGLEFVAAVASIFVLSSALSACAGGTTSGTAPPTSSAHAKTTDQSACALVTPAQVTTIMGTSVNAPSTRNRGSTTTCTYPAPDPTRSVIIEYQGGATIASFDSGQKAFEARYGKTTPLSGLGSQAYVGMGTSGQQKSFTIVVLVGSTQIVVIGTNSVGQVERMAAEVLSELYAHSSRGSTTTTAASTASTPSTTGSRRPPTRRARLVYVNDLYVNDLYVSGLDRRAPAGSCRWTRTSRRPAVQPARRGVPGEAPATLWPPRAV